MSTDEFYMNIAIELAKKGEGYTHPNPVVGCVVVDPAGEKKESQKVKELLNDISLSENRDLYEGSIVAFGYHRAYGEFHAERDALTDAGDEVESATMYVTLEPCAHTGKTPPCTDIIIEKKIKRVVIGSYDPNPLVSGRGIEKLRGAHIKVDTECMKKECDALNEVFFHYITTGYPYIAMKYAMTLDGRICTRTGDSKWISSNKSREDVQHLRKKYAAILCGIGTVLSDDPMLNYRSKGSLGDKKLSPIRIVLDSSLKIPLDSNIVKTAKEYKTIVAYVSGDATKKKELEDAGIFLMSIDPDESGRMDILILLKRLGQEKIDSVLIEGGAGIHGALIDAHIRSGKKVINRVYAYIAPKLIGGISALSPTGGEGVDMLSDAITLCDVETIHIGDDICITGSTAVSK